MRNKIHLLITFILLNSCSVNKLITEANQSFSRKEFAASAEKFLKANPKIKDRRSKADVCYKLAESYRQLGEYSRSAIWFRNAIRFGEKDSTIQLQYADALRGAGKPDEAKPIYKAQLKKNPKNKWAANGIEAIKRIQRWKDVQQLYELEILRPLNSFANDEVAQILSDKEPTVCLVSSRETIPDKRINPETGHKFAGFFTSTRDSITQRWSVPHLMNTPETINSPDEELGFAENEKSGIIVFARQIPQSSGPAISRIFYLMKKDNTWTEPELLPFETDQDDYTDPMITEDGKTLWFASTRAGGKGGFDIWKSEIKGSGIFSEPQNAGPEINTQGNEIYPFQKPNGYFYFSSDFQPGLGGYDIFQAQKINSGKWKVTQLPPPVNSPGDDLSIRYFGNLEKGFFSSNRRGSRSLDIYSFYLPPTLFQCHGKIHDSETNAILPEVNVKIVGSDGSSQTVRTVNGEFQVNLNPESDYAIVVFASGYLNAQAKISTRGLHEPKKFDVDIKPVPTNRPIRIRNIQYEFGKWNLLPQSKKALDQLIELLKINPKAIIEISSHTDEVGSKKFNQELSEKRAASVINYLTVKGIPSKNLKSKGYGETEPLVVNQKQAQEYKFLHTGETLDNATIEKLDNKNFQEIARGLNRRTEFKVIQTTSGLNTK